MKPITQEDDRLGFVGIGYMGRPIARRAPAHLGKLQRAMKSDYSPQFPIRLMNKDFGLILNLAAVVGARMPATGAAFEINARQSDEGAEQDFSAVILQMEKRAHLGSSGNGRM